MVTALSRFSLELDYGGIRLRAQERALITQTVLKPTQVGWHKCAKAYERTTEKELGKMTL